MEAETPPQHARSCGDVTAPVSLWKKASSSLRDAAGLEPNSELAVAARC